MIFIVVCYNNVEEVVEYFDKIVHLDTKTVDYYIDNDELEKLAGEY